MSRPTAVTTLLAEGENPLAQLARQVLAHNRDIVFVRRCLGEPDAAHVTEVSRRGSTAILTLDAAAWASRVRLRHTELIEALRRARPDDAPSALRFRVQSKSAISPRRGNREPRRPRLSPASRQILRQAAEAMDDPRLRDRLLALSRTGS